MAETARDAKDVALATLSNLIRFMGVELVAGSHRDDLFLFERAMRTKVGAVTINGCSTEVAEAGLVEARSHVEQALAMIRAQALSSAVFDLPKPVPMLHISTSFLH